MILSLLLFGCSTKREALVFKNPLEWIVLSSHIEDGKTKESELLKMFGKPSSVGTDFHGRKLYMWLDTSQAQLGYSVKLRVVVVNGKVFSHMTIVGEREYIFGSFPGSLHAN